MDKKNTNLSFKKYMALSYFYASNTRQQVAEITDYSQEEDEGTNVVEFRSLVFSTIYVLHKDKTCPMPVSLDLKIKHAFKK